MKKTIVYIALLFSCFLTAQVTISGGQLVGGNTDNQELTIENDSLKLDNGGAIDLTPYLDSQTISSFAISNDSLVLSLSGGSIQKVDLSTVIGSGGGGGGFVLKEVFEVAPDKTIYNGFTVTDSLEVGSSGVGAATTYHISRELADTGSLNLSHQQDETGKRVYNLVSSSATITKEIDNIRSGEVNESYFFDVNHADGQIKIVEGDATIEGSNKQVGENTYLISGWGSANFFEVSDGVFKVSGDGIWTTTGTVLANLYTINDALGNPDANDVSNWSDSSNISIASTSTEKDSGGFSLIATQNASGTFESISESISLSPGTHDFKVRFKAPIGALGVGARVRQVPIAGGNAVTIGSQYVDATGDWFILNFSIITEGTNSVQIQLQPSFSTDNFTELGASFISYWDSLEIN